MASSPMLGQAISPRPISKMLLRQPQNPPNLHHHHHQQQQQQLKFKSRALLEIWISNHLPELFPLRNLQQLLQFKSRALLEIWISTQLMLPSTHPAPNRITNNQPQEKDGKHHRIRMIISSMSPSRSSNRHRRLVVVFGTAVLPFVYRIVVIILFSVFLWLVWNPISVIRQRKNHTYIRST